MNSRDVTVVGVGRIGAVTAVGLAHLLHRVTGVDTNPHRVAELEQGDLTEAEPGLRSALRSALRLRDIRFSASVAPGSSDVAFLCVDTPPAADGSADLRQLFAAAATARAALRHGGILVVRSTIPPGTCEELERACCAAGRADIEVAHVPEFLREGRCWEDFRQPDRLVIGAESAAVRSRLAEMFAELDTPIILTTTRTAELSKYAANAFLATSVSFANEISDLGEALGADARTVFEILRADSRIGRLAYLRPGLGFGGHCLPKDTAALRAVGEQFAAPMPQLEATIAVNQQRVHRVTSWLVERLGDLHQKRVAICGLSFKPGTDDLRASPAMRLASLLRVMGAEVTGFDATARAELDGVCVRPSLLGAVEGADALVVSHPVEALEPGPETLAIVMRRPLVYDAPGLLDLPPWLAAGFECNRTPGPLAHAVEAVTQ